MPEAGKAVKKGDVIVQLLPLLSPEGRITMAASLADADGQLKTTAARVETARIALDRAKNAAQGTVAKTVIEAAEGNHEEAVEAHEAAKNRRNVLAKALGELEKGTASPVPLVAPHAGLLRTVSALPGQTVPSGADLFEVLDLSTVWVRVPLPVGDLDGLDRTVPAQVGKLAASPGTASASAKPVAAPPSANPLAGTVDAFYELPNADGKLHPGQRLGVTVPLADTADSPTVPWSAVVFDSYGSTWVYEQTAPHAYARRRVSVKYTDPADSTTAVLDAALAPKPGTSVVTAGVQQLFAAATGFIK